MDAKRELFAQLDRLTPPHAILATNSSTIVSSKLADATNRPALNHPIGPFALMDLTGIDVNYYVRMQRMQETGNPELGPKQSVVEKFQKGELGRKTGKGWYAYTKGQ